MWNNNTPSSNINLSSIIKPVMSHLFTHNKVNSDAKPVHRRGNVVINEGVSISTDVRHVS